MRVMTTNVFIFDAPLRARIDADTVCQSFSHEPLAALLCYLRASGRNTRFFFPPLHPFPPPRRFPPCFSFHFFRRMSLSLVIPKGFPRFIFADLLFLPAPSRFFSPSHHVSWIVSVRFRSPWQILEGLACRCFELLTRFLFFIFSLILTPFLSPALCFPPLRVPVLVHPIPRGPHLLPCLTPFSSLFYVAPPRPSPLNFVPWSGRKCDSLYRFPFSQQPDLSLSGNLPPSFA